VTFTRRAYELLHFSGLLRDACGHESMNEDKSSQPVRAIGARMRIQTISLHVLLMINVINGAVPDSQSLVSLRSIQLFCLVDDSPVSWDDESNSPDESNATVQVRRNLRNRERRKDSWIYLAEPVGSPARLTGLPAVLFDWSRRDVARFDGRNHLLCRLDC
jgi:hypothetical protein